MDAQLKPPPSKRDLLEWIRRTLPDMPENHINPDFLRMPTILDRKTFEFLYEQVRTVRYKTHKTHIEYIERGTVANFIAQIVTSD